MPTRYEAVPPLATPALLVDLGAFEANVAAISVLLRDTGTTVRPHVKTHRTPELARRQLGGDAIGVTCATVGEAEAMVEAGILDVLVANEVVDATRIRRLALLARVARVAVAVDAREPVEALAAEAIRLGVTVDVLVDVDVRLNRCGVATPAEAAGLAQRCVDRPGIRLRGIMGYEGRLRPDMADRERQIQQAYLRLGDAREAIMKSGVPCPVVSAAGTSTLREAIACPWITEVQAGVYAIMEPDLDGLGLPFRRAVTVRGTVISRHADRVVVDAGRRAIGTEAGPPIWPGGAGSTTVSDEHTVVPMVDPAPLGGTLDLVPRQVRTTFNLHDWVWVTRNGQVVDRWAVAARGRSQ